MKEEKAELWILFKSEFRLGRMMLLNYSVVFSYGYV